MACGALVTDSPCKSVSPIMWAPFDRQDLLRENFIDTNVIVHSRAASEKFGGWDEALGGFQDWDLVLRYSIEQPPLQLPVLAAKYRTHAHGRMSASSEKATRYQRFRKKWPLN